MMKVLVDAELILGFFLNNELAPNAEKVLEMAESGKIEIYITEICLDKIRSIDEQLTAEDRIADEVEKKFNVIPCDTMLRNGILGQYVSERLIECAIEEACAKSKNLFAIVTHKPELYKFSSFNIITSQHFVDLDSLSRELIIQPFNQDPCIYASISESIRKLSDDLSDDYGENKEICKHNVEMFLMGSFRSSSTYVIINDIDILIVQEKEWSL